MTAASPKSVGKFKLWLVGQKMYGAKIYEGPCSFKGMKDGEAIGFCVIKDFG